MTNRAEIDRLLQMTGRTLEGLPETYSSAERARRFPEIVGNKPFGDVTLHQSDVIELLVCALRDALDKPMQKPLTLDDVLSLDSIGDAWWVEYKDGNLVPTILTNDCHQYGEQILDGYTFKLFDYGKSWRCWASKPTDEEREAAAWES